MCQDPTEMLPGAGIAPEPTTTEVIVAGIFFLAMIAGLPLVTMAVQREDRASSLCDDATDALARPTRRITGLGSRDLGLALLRPIGGFTHRPPKPRQMFYRGSDQVFR